METTRKDDKLKAMDYVEVIDEGETFIMRISEVVNADYPDCCLVCGIEVKPGATQPKRWATLPSVKRITALEASRQAFDGHPELQMLYDAIVYEDNEERTPYLAKELQ